jgi:hypothetical protein
MANLRDPFTAYYAPEEALIATAMHTGLVAPDTNVMLAAYRIERQAREQLFSAFAELGDRLWIPHQVAFEFHRNRLGVIAGQEAFFEKSRADLDGSISSYLGKLKAFTGRIAMPQTRSQDLEQKIRDAHAEVLAQVASYADKDKADPTGDYLVWKQLLHEAAARRLPVVLVTDDRKEDWVRREHGLTLGPRPELCEEMSAITGAPFLLMSTAIFLRHAEQYLGVSVSQETVDQAKELPVESQPKLKASNVSFRRLIFENALNRQAPPAVRR